MHSEKAYSVTQINKYLKAVLDEDYILKSIRIQGEISNLSLHSHMYFTLKDETSSISCVMFAGDAAAAQFVPQNGMSVIVTGSITVFVKTGQYQLYAKKIEREGKGSLHERFEELKKRLLNEGLFDDSHKRRLPKDPKLVAVITSPTGAAVRDIVSVARRRNRSVKLAIFPVLVQGDQAAESIVEAIGDVNRLNEADVIIVGRGGGSIEDLWAFNEEIVARAVFASEIPVISAVGHQTDFTITDFAADVRAATPSVSAELAIPLLMNKAELVENAVFSAERGICAIFASKYNELSLKVNAVGKLAPSLMYGMEGSVFRTVGAINKAMSRTVEIKEAGFLSTVNLLEAVSPLSVLKRGYSLTFKDGALVKSTSDVDEGDIITTALADGEVVSEVKAVNYQRYENG